MYSPSRLGNDHLGAQLEELLPELLRLQVAVDGLQFGTVALRLHLQLAGFALFVGGGRVGGGGFRGLGARPVEWVLGAVDVTVLLVRHNIDVNILRLDVRSVVQLILGLNACLGKLFCGGGERK